MKKFIILFTALAVSLSSPVFAGKRKATAAPSHSMETRSRAKKARLEQEATQPVQPSSLSMEIDTPAVQEGYVRLVSSDGVIFELPLKTAFLSEFIKNALNPDIAMAESANRTIEFGEIESSNLSFIIECMTFVGNLKTQQPNYSDHRIMRELYSKIDLLSLSTDDIKYLLDLTTFLEIPLLYTPLYFMLFNQSLASESMPIDLLPHMQYHFEHLARAIGSNQEVTRDQLIDLNIIPASFAGAEDINCYLKHPMTKPFLNKALKSFILSAQQKAINETSLIEQPELKKSLIEGLVVVVRKVITHELQSATPRSLAELVATFNAQPRTHLYMVLFIEYYLQTNLDYYPSNTSALVALENGAVLCAIAQKIKCCIYYKSNRLRFTHTQGINALLEPLLEILEPLIGNSIHSIDLSSCQLSGPIPATIISLAQLRDFSFANNQLTGPIPNEIGNLTQLIYFSFADNQLTGPIPNEIGNLTQIERIILCNNQLTGPIPVSIATLARLVQLFLEHNQITGQLPAILRSKSISKDDTVIFAD